MQSIDAPEEWRPVVGYEGRYEVSNLGRVRSVARTIVKCNGSTSHIEMRILRTPKREGYPSVQLNGGGEPRVRHVHRLVIESFVGPANGRECCHNNGNRSDNRLSNLRWGTRSENSLDRELHGTNHERNKTHCPYGHRLESPNLVRWQWVQRRHRSCLSCDRARKYLQRHPELVDKVRELADEYYRKMTAELEGAEE